VADKGLDRAVLEAAARWYAALHDTDAHSGVEEAFRDWLDRDPEHRRAWARVEKLNAAMSAAPGEVVRPTLEKARVSRRRAVKLLLLVVGTSGLAGGWLQTDWGYRITADHYAGTGERKSVRLADGSRLELNTRTAIDIRFDGRQQQVRLLTGEIQITTATGQGQRPFVVITDHGRVRALGTRFTVRSDNGASRVSVLEHAVEVRSATNAPPVRVEAGLQVRFTPDRIDRPEAITGHPAAWTRGQLIVSDWPLGRFLDELSRYHHGMLVYDPAVAEMRISGAFHIADTDAVLDNLATTLPLRIRRLTPLWTRVEPRAR